MSSFLYCLWLELFLMRTHYSFHWTYYCCSIGINDVTDYTGILSLFGFVFIKFENLGSRSWLSVFYFHVCSGCWHCTVSKCLSSLFRMFQLFLQFRWLFFNHIFTSLRCTVWENLIFLILHISLLGLLICPFCKVHVFPHFTHIFLCILLWISPLINCFLWDSSLLFRMSDFSF